MPAQQRTTPGVYITEIDANLPSIVGIETAVPAFIGYTERAVLGGKSYVGKPVRISSMVDYDAVFGGGPRAEFTFKEVTNPTDPVDIELTVGDTSKPHAVQPPSAWYYLFSSLRLFYANGGGPCYIVSVGGYRGGVERDELLAGLAAIQGEIGPTMLVIPDAMLLPDRAGFAKVASEMIKQCGAVRDRVAILDVYGSDKLPPPVMPQNTIDELIKNFRADAGTESLKYGVAYFPSVHASLIQESDLSLANFDAKSVKLLADTAAKMKGVDPRSPQVTTMAAIVDAATKEETAEKAEDDAAAAEDAFLANIKQLEDAAVAAKEAVNSAAEAEKAAKTAEAAAADKALVDAREPEAALRKAADTAHTKAKTARAAVVYPVIPQLQSANDGLRSGLAGLKQCYTKMASVLNILPVSGAMAGIYAQSDRTRGVWNAPANISLSSVVGTTFKITGNAQGDNHVPIHGKAINAIREFVGRGPLMWGARTLDDNSNDWRYIQVCRTMIYIEQSVQMALNQLVFAPNDGRTWATVTAMISNFLHGLWSQGGLMGAKASEAFGVQCGLGTTMTGLDVLEGSMRVHITLQMLHPDEFIELNFKQQMQGV